MRPSGFWARLRAARLFRVLILYLAASWIILQATAILRNEFQLPQWVTPFVVLLLVIGLVIVSATAWVQSHPATKAREPDVPAGWELDIKDLASSIAQRRLPHLTWARAILGGVFAFSLLFGAAGLYVLLTERGAEFSPVKKAVAGPGPGIAVLPFRVVGPDLELWREGVVDLLSTNLDGAAGLRKIDPRTVLSKWRSEIGEGKEAPDPEAALRVARDAGASYAVMGSIVGSRGELRITAEVYDLATGKLQGTTQVGGSPDSVLALVDALSIEFLRKGMVREPTDLPQLAVSRITTSSLPALKAYLAGEQAYRRNRFEEAIPHFARAVEADSTFALALSRLSKMYGWLEAFSPRTLEYSQRAVRFAERLPEREALLLRGGAEMDEGRLAAIQMLEELTTRYPDHVEGWYELGEAYFHIGAQGLHPPEKFRNAFRRAVELDPTFGPAYIHLINDAFYQHDSAAATELIARYQRIDPASPDVTGQLLVYALAWGDSVSKEQARLALDTAQTQAVAAPWLSLLNAPDLWKELIEVARELLQPRHPSVVRNFGKWGIVRAYAVRGKVREARESVKKGSAILGQEAYDPPNSRAYLGWHLAGATDSTGARRAAAVLASDPAPWDRFLLGALAAQEKRCADVQKEMHALESEAQQAASRRDTLRAAEMQSFAEALQGYAALRRGERREAMRALQGALPRLPGIGPGFIRSGIHALLRYELGKLLLEIGNLQEAERYFASIRGEGDLYDTMSELYLGEIHEGLGDIEQAKLHYARFVRWFEDCDPEFRPLWEQGRQALMRLTGERGAS